MNVVESLQEKASVREIAKQSKAVTFDVASAVIEKDILYCRKSLSGLTGIQQLMKQQDKQQDGVRNIDSAKLSGGTAFLVTGIVVSTAVAAAKLANESEISAVDFTTSQIADGKFYNSELSIKINSKEKMKAILRHMCSEDAGDNKFEDSAYSVSPFIIPSNNIILPELNIFDAPCAVDKDVIIEIAFVGYKITESH